MKSEGFAAVVSRLQSALARCADVPDVAAVHHARTGSRRLEAVLEALECAAGGDDLLEQTAARLRKLLKKIRHKAGKVRDIDVERELLRKLAFADEVVGEAAISPQIAALDAKLERKRRKAAEKFQQKAAHWSDRLEMKADAVLQAALEGGDSPVRESDAMALESFARLCEQISVLNEGTLHDFRKGAKHARYMAEMGESDWSRRTAKCLKRIQDAIGLWHDWLMLAAEARDVSDGHGNELAKCLEAKRNLQFLSALKTTMYMRKELLAEWEAQFCGKKNAASADGNVPHRKLA